jgi:hypothetical protein
VDDDDVDGYLVAMSCEHCLDAHAHLAVGSMVVIMMVAAVVIVATEVETEALETDGVLEVLETFEVVEGKSPVVVLSLYLLLVILLHPL